MHHSTLLIQTIERLINKPFHALQHHHITPHIRSSLHSSTTNTTATDHYHTTHIFTLPIAYYPTLLHTTHSALPTTARLHVLVDQPPRLEKRMYAQHTRRIHSTQQLTALRTCQVCVGPQCAGQQQCVAISHV